MVNNESDFDLSKLTDGHVKLFQMIARRAKKFRDQLEVLKHEACEVCGIKAGTNHPLEQVLDDLIFSGYTADEVVEYLQALRESEPEE